MCRILEPQIRRLDLVTPGDFRPERPRFYLEVPAIFGMFVLEVHIFLS